MGFNRPGRRGNPPAAQAHCRSRRRRTVVRTLEPKSVGIAIARNRAERIEPTDSASARPGRAIFGGGVRSRLKIPVAFWLLLAPVACGGPTLSDGVYRDDGLRFRIGTLPHSYSRLSVDGIDLAYRDSNARATIAVNARCGKDADDVPLTSLTHHLFLQFTDIDVSDQREFTMDGRAALRTEAVAKLDGVAQHFVVVVLKKNGCVYDFMLITPPDSAAASVRTFDAFVSGFSTVRKAR